MSTSKHNIGLDEDLVELVLTAWVRNGASSAHRRQLPLSEPPSPGFLLSGLHASMTSGPTSRLYASTA